MSIIKVMQGDLLKLFKEGAFQAIAHGCNCRNLMGAGVADQIRQQFPEAYEADTDMHSRVGSPNFGQHDIVAGLGGNLSIGHTKWGQVFNLYTQLETGRNGDYQLLQRAMKNLNKFCKQRSISRIGVPLIGAGIAGLDIMAAMVIMDQCTPDVDVVVVTWTGDQKSWEKASQFMNYSFPRKFDGVMLRTSSRGDVLVKTLHTDVWIPMSLNREIATIMQINRDMCVSMSHKDPFIYLIINDKKEFEENILKLF